MPTSEREREQTREGESVKNCSKDQTADKGDREKKGERESSVLNVQRENHWRGVALKYYGITGHARPSGMTKEDYWNVGSTLENVNGTF